MRKRVFADCPILSDDDDVLCTKTQGDPDSVAAYLVRQANNGRIEAEEYRNAMGGDDFG